MYFRSVLSLLPFLNSWTPIVDLDWKISNYELYPVYKQKSAWKLRAPEGSKIIISCLADTTCFNNSIRIIFDEKNWSICSKYIDNPYELNTTLLEVHIDPLGNENIYCNVTVTKSYLNDNYKSIESGEEGKEIETKPSCRCGWTNKGSVRVVGGKRSLKHEYPFMAIVGLEGGQKLICGGSIITAYHVLTAAHCTHPFMGDRTFLVLVGVDSLNETDSGTGVQKIRAKKAFVHSKYHSEQAGSAYDISILYLETKIKFNEWVGPVCMPKFSSAHEGDYLKVLGWGKQYGSANTISNYLMKANLKIIDTISCKKIYQGRIIRHTQICTYHPRKDSCYGDSGSPLVMVNPKTNMLTQHALVSFGKSCRSSDPAVNTNVSSYIDWIEDVIKETRNESLCY